MTFATGTPVTDTNPLPVSIIDENGVIVDYSQPVPTVSTSRYPIGAMPIAAASGNVANSVAAATLPNVVGRTTYLTGFEVTGAGATAAAAVSVTVTGVQNGPLTYTYCAATGVAVANQPLIIEFDPPLPASGTGVDVVVSCPALGAGNTKNTVVAHGYQV